MIPTDERIVHLEPGVYEVKPDGVIMRREPCKGCEETTPRDTHTAEMDRLRKELAQAKEAEQRLGHYHTKLTKALDVEPGTSWLGMIDGVERIVHCLRASQKASAGLAERVYKDSSELLEAIGGEDRSWNQMIKSVAFERSERKRLVSDAETIRKSLQEALVPGKQGTTYYAMSALIQLAQKVSADNRWLADELEKEKARAGGASWKEQAATYKRDVAYALGADPEVAWDLTMAQLKKRLGNPVPNWVADTSDISAGAFEDSAKALVANATRAAVDYIENEIKQRRKRDVAAERGSRMLVYIEKLERLKRALFETDRMKLKECLDDRDVAVEIRQRAANLLVKT